MAGNRKNKLTFGCAVRPLQEALNLFISFFAFTGDTAGYQMKFHQNRLVINGLWLNIGLIGER